MSLTRQAVRNPHGAYGDGKGNGIHDGHVLDASPANYLDACATQARCMERVFVRRSQEGNFSISRGRGHDFNINKLRDIGKVGYNRSKDGAGWVSRRMPHRLVLPPIPPEQGTPLVEALLGIVQVQAERIQRQEEQIELLKEEIRILKGLKKRPRFKPSGMEEQTEADKGKDEGKKDSRRPGSNKRNKTAELVIHEEKILTPAGRIPRGARFKGYRDVVVQELQIQCHNTRYRLERWVTARGKSLCAELPAELAGHHFGPKLRSYILYQHHHCQVTQPLLHEQLREWGLDISTGAIDAILTNDQEVFHTEKDALLERGLASARYVTVDDSGARHQGHNGYVTQIGNAFFAWFCSTLSKSRINFLTLLCAGVTSRDK